MQAEKSPSSYMREGMPVKRLKVEDYSEVDLMENKENAVFGKDQAKQSTLVGKGSHISDLSLEEGAILIENWKKTNFSEFNTWLENACAQATFQIEEKLSMDNKSKKSKPVQIKSFQCHLHLKFMDNSLESLIGSPSITQQTALAGTRKTRGKWPSNRWSHSSFRKN
jgi:hypothetical protein